MGCAKNYVKIAKKKKQLNENRWIYVKERGATRILFYSICAVVPVFITGVRLLLLSESKKSSAPFISPLLAEKNSLLNVVLYRIGKILSP